MGNNNEEFQTQKSSWLTITSEWVEINSDIKITILKEVFINAMLSLPRTLFNENRFKRFQITTNSIKIDYLEWSIFTAKFLSMFNIDNPNRKEFSDRMSNFFKEYERFVQELILKKEFTYDKINECFDWLEKADSYSIFNVLAPFGKCEEEIESEFNGEFSLSDFMICAFVPHRNMIRKEKLRLAYFQKVENDSNKLEQGIKEYQENILPFEFFEQWLFDTRRYSESKYLRREIKKIAQSYTTEEILDEIDTIDLSRKNNINLFLNNCFKIQKSPKKSLINFLVFFSEIVSEEEKRHMLNSKVYLYLGLAFQNIDIDMSRNNREKLLSVYRNESV